METLTAKILDYLKGQSFQVAVVFAVVLTLTWLLRNRSAHIRYLLWLLVAIKCLTPPMMIFSVPILPNDTPTQSPAIKYQPMPTAYQQTQNTVITVTPAEMQSQVPIENRKSKIENFFTAHLNFTPTNILISVWAAGGAFYLLWAAAKAIRLQLWLKQNYHPVPPQMAEEIAELCRLWNPNKVFTVRLLDNISQPFVWGLWRGTIYLPSRVQSIQTDRQKAVVMHEMAHVVRWDSLLNLIQILIQGLFWFHPLVWLANRFIRQEREKCCDETAIARLNTQPKEYGSAIIETLVQEYHNTIPIPSLAVAGPIKNIEDRIKTIMQPGKRFFRRPSIIALLIIGCLAALVVPTTIALTQKNIPPDYPLSGVVVDAATGKPITGAIVFDNGYGPEPYQKGITDADGKFEYKSWNEEHNVAAKADGYESQSMTFTTAPIDNSKKLDFKLQNIPLASPSNSQFAAPTIGVNANPQDANQPMDRTLYFKLPLAQPRFHWKFTNKDLYLSGKLVLRIIRDEQINEIVVFNKGEITKGWEAICSESGPQDNAIYFGFHSTARYSTTPNDKVELELIAKEDLDGIGRLQTGVLKAGTHKALGNLKIYSTDSDTAYIEWQDKWLLDITSEEGWMTSKQGFFINDNGALRPLTRAEKKRICAGANWGNRNFFGHCDISLMENIETKNDNENHFRKIRIRKGVIKTRIDITEFADKRQEQVQSKTSLVSERDSSGYFTQRFDHSSKKVFLEDGSLNGDYSIFEFGRIDPKIAITIGILCYLFDDDNQVEQFENATVFSDTADVDQFQLINLKDNSIIYTFELNKMDWGLCRKIQWYNKGSNTLSKSIEYANFNRPVEFKTQADPGDSGYLLPYKTVRRYFDNERNEEKTEKLEIIDAAMVSNEKKLNYYVLQQNYGNDFNFETPYDYMIIDRRSQGGQGQLKVSGEMKTPDYPDVPLRSGKKTEAKIDTEEPGESESVIPSTSRIDETGRIVDKLDYPFVNDPDLIGVWESVDFVKEVDQFQAEQEHHPRKDLFWKNFVILPQGRTLQPGYTWTKGLILYSNDKTASRYVIKEIEGSQYMFFEWKSGDYTVRHQKPSWYVLKKIPLGTEQPMDSSSPSSLSPSTPNDPAAVEILKKTQSLYEGLTSYSSEGEVITDMDMSEVDVNAVYGLTEDVSKELQKTQEGQNILKKHPSFKNAFSIRLARPLYYIEWAQKVHENYTNTGAVWSDGQKHYQLVAGKKSLVEDREMALAAAVGVSGGASSNIPRLFYGNSTLTLENVKQEGRESIDGDQCYIITGTVANIPTKYWISQKTLLIRQSQERFGNIPRLSVELSEEELKKALESAGQPVTDEAVQQLKKTMESYQAAASKTKGSITETHRNIVVNQPIDFEPYFSKYRDMEITPPTNSQSSGGGINQPN